MQITLKEILSFPQYEDLKVIAGQTGLNRKVSTVTILDAPDGYKWTKGGEFVITSGYVISDAPQELEKIITQLDEMGASAFGIKLNRFIDRIPDRVLKKADQLNFPIITIPESYPFKNIINPVLTSIINKQNEKLVFSKNIHDTFTQLVLEECNEKNIIIKLEQLINKGIIFYNKEFDELKFGSLMNEDDFKDYSVEDMKDNLQSYCLQIDQKVYGYIFVTGSEEVDDYDEIAIEHAGTVLKLEVQKRISNEEIESRYRDEYVLDLISGNINTKEEAFKRGRLYNWDFDAAIAVMIVDIDEFKKNYTDLEIKETKDNLKEIRKKIFLVTRNILNRYFNNILYTNLSDKIIFLIKHNDIKEEYNIEIKKIADKIREKVSQKVDFTVTVGLGDYKEDVFSIQKSYREAQEAVKIGRLISIRNSTSLYNTLGAYRLLDSIYNSEKAGKFIESYLGKLIDYEKKNDINLIENLQVLIQNDWNMKKAAGELFIHYNTMKYRMKKVEEILEIDLAKSEDRFNLNLALKLLQIKEK